MSGESESEPTWLALPPASAEEAEAGGIKRSFSTDEYDEEEDDKSKIRRLESELGDAKTELVFLTGILKSMDRPPPAPEQQQESQTGPSSSAAASSAPCTFVGCPFPSVGSMVKHIREFHCPECKFKFCSPWSKRSQQSEEEEDPINTNHQDDVLTLAAVYNDAATEEESD